MSKEANVHPEKGSFEVKVGLAEMLKGGVIMDVTTPDQARIAEDSGAVAVMALEKRSSCGYPLPRRSSENVSIPN